MQNRIVVTIVFRGVYSKVPIRVIDIRNYQQESTANVYCTLQSYHNIPRTQQKSHFMLCILFCQFDCNFSNS